MSYTLYLGGKNYSSWSLRGALLLDAFGIPYNAISAETFDKKDFEPLIAQMEPSKTVPALKTSDGMIVWDSLAMAEYLHEQHPDAGIWPVDTTARAAARCITAEMHSGFTNLRGACPMNMRRDCTTFTPDQGVLDDLARLSKLWAWARAQFEGPYLCGAYSAVDAFFTPVASRIRTYHLPMNEIDLKYVDALLSYPATVAWTKEALKETAINPVYEAVGL